MTQSVKHPTLGFGSGCDLRVVRLRPVLGSKLNSEDFNKQKFSKNKQTNKKGNPPAKEKGNQVETWIYSEKRRTQEMVTIPSNTYFFLIKKYLFIR